MKVREPYAHLVDPCLFDDEPTERECTSVGVLVHTGILVRGSFPSFLFLEQLDVENCPWGIPSGRVELYESHPPETAKREVLEETGMSIGVGGLRDFLRIAKGEKTKIVYSYGVSSRTKVFPFGDWSREKGIYGDIYVTKNQRHSDEIGRMAFVPADELFDRGGHPVVSSYYRWDITRQIKLRLKGLRII